jgi:hypothetical protein
MISDYVNSLAVQMGIHLSKVSVIDGRDVGCLDVHLLRLSSSDQNVSVLVRQSDLDELMGDSGCDKLEQKIRSALSRLEA